MRIVSSTMSMAATHRVARSEESSAEMRTWLSRPPAPQRPERSDRFDRFDRSPRATDGIDGCRSCDDDGSTTNDPKLQVLIAIIEKFTGRPVHVIDASEVTGERHEGAAPAPRGRGWGMQIDAVHRVEETEQTAVSIRASITEADGTQRELQLDLTM